MDTANLQPADVTVTRLFRTADIARDRFDVGHDGRHLAEIDYLRARQFWLGRITLADLLEGAASTND